ncbi:hypothetical protein DACRYDRAFT_23335 [Dacryopinax primogenitus]|uniref:Uncharacterized protein n=1 Tax=Dacryopinax primogenitus (strain DJM 731) TaxID=1858805 RepID=M5G3L0_DACPD|nr:uncharacterized protein DACRYDRAFT_23335 [Dacryopinax primogenitus]EJU00447.1 hypothetical protein DACRYDRAFT_23335 [Dacryopinax primogenitus]
MHYAGMLSRVLCQWPKGQNVPLYEISQLYNLPSGYWKLHHRSTYPVAHPFHTDFSHFLLSMTLLHSAAQNEEETGPVDSEVSRGSGYYCVIA